MVLKSLLQRPKPERPQDFNKCSGRVKSRDDSIGCCIDATLRRIASSGYQAAADESMGSVENHQAETTRSTPSELRCQMPSGASSAAVGRKELP